MEQGRTEEESSPEELSGDVLLQVFQHLDTRGLIACSCACKQWQELASTDTLWQQRWKDDFGLANSYRLSSNEMGGCALRTSLPDIEQQADSARRALGGGPAKSWRDIYRTARDVDRNWDRGTSSARTLHGHGDFIRCLQLAGDTMVSASGSISHQDCTIRVWGMETGSCKQVLRGHMGPIWCMAYDHNSHRIASGSDDYTVRYWDELSGNSVSLQDPGSAVRCINMDTSRRQLVAGTEFGRLLLWDMDHLEGLLAASVERVRQEFERLAHDATDAEAREEARLHPGAPPRPGDGVARYRGQTAQELMDSRRVVVDGTNNKVAVVDAAEEGKAISAIQVQDGLCASTSIEPLSRIQLWDVSGWQWDLKATVGDDQMMFANSLSFEKSLGRMVAGCGDKNMRVWDLETHARLHLLSGHIDEVHAHQFDERTLASAALNGHIRLWDMRSGECTGVLEHDAPVHAFQFSGHRLVSGTWDGRVCLWDLRRNALVREWEQHNERVWAVSMDRYGAVSAALDHTITVRSFLPDHLAFAGWPGAGSGSSGAAVGSSAAEAPVP